MKYAADDNKLEKLSNALLDAAFEPSARDIAAVGGKLSAAGLAEVGGEAAAAKLREEGFARDREYGEEVGRQLLRGRIRQALDTKDLDSAFVLAESDPELLRFVARAVAYKRGPGEQKHRPRDYSPSRQKLFGDLWSEIDLLRELWKRKEIKVTGPKEAALRIVVRRYQRQCRAPGKHGPVPDYLKGKAHHRPGDLMEALRIWDKNHPRRRC